MTETGIDFVAEEFKYLEKRIMRAMIVNEGVRADGRHVEDVRPIWCEVGVLPRAHGSAVFTRGQTQILSAVTLAGPGMAQEATVLTRKQQKIYAQIHLPRILSWRS